MEPVTEGENLLQNGREPIAQTAGESVSEVCVNEPLSKSHSYRQVIPFEERYFEAAQNKRNLMKTKCFVLVFLVTMAVIVIGICVPVAAILSGKLSDNRR